MCTSWTLDRSLLCEDSVTAVTALPPNLVVADDHLTLSYALEQLDVATLVLSLNLCNLTECLSDLWEALAVSDSSKLSIEYVPLLVLALSSCEKVLGSCANLTSWV